MLTFSPVRIVQRAGKPQKCFLISSTFPQASTHNLVREFTVKWTTSFLDLHDNAKSLEAKIPSSADTEGAIMQDNQAQDL